MLRVVQGTFKDHVDKLRKFFPHHYNEAGENILEFQGINEEMYQILEDKGMLLCVGAKDEFDDVHAYLTASLFTNPHNIQESIAHVDALYVSPALRTGLAGVKILKQMLQLLEHLCYNKNITMIRVGSSMRHSIIPLLERWGYFESERIYTKVVTGD